MRKWKLSQVKEFSKISMASMDLNPDLAAKSMLYPVNLADLGDTAVCDNCGWQSMRHCQPTHDADFSVGASML